MKIQIDIESKLNIETFHLFSVTIKDRIMYGIKYKKTQTYLRENTYKLHSINPRLHSQQRLKFVSNQSISKLFSVLAKILAVIS